jgi:hypothetical protein
MIKRRQHGKVNRIDFDPYDDPAEIDLEEEEEEEEGEEEEEDDEDEDDESGKGKKKLTQEAFERAVIQARKSARSAAEKRMLEALGVKTIEEAKALMTAKKSNKEGGDEEADASELAQLRQQNAQLQADILKRETDGKIKDALIDAGLGGKAASKAVKLVELDNSNPSDEEIEEAIVELKETMPALFATTSNDDDDEEDERNGTSRGTQPPAPKRKRRGASAEERAKEIFRQRHPQSASK